MPPPRRQPEDVEPQPETDEEAPPPPDLAATQVALRVDRQLDRLVHLAVEADRRTAGERAFAAVGQHV